MHITESPFDLDQQITSIDGKAARSPGCHLSNITGSLERKYGRLKGRTDIDSDNQEQWKDYRNAGFLIERVFREMLADLNLVKVGELCVDNVYMTPDFLDANDWVLEEWKCTWRSMSPDIANDPNFQAWWIQIKAYCRAIVTNKARLRVFWVNGNYRPRKPLFMTYSAEFTPRDLDENWQMCLNHGRSEKLI